MLSRASSTLFNDYYNRLPRSKYHLEKPYDMIFDLRVSRVSNVSLARMLTFIEGRRFSNSLFFNLNIYIYSELNHNLNKYISLLVGISWGLSWGLSWGSSWSLSWGLSWSLSWSLSWGLSWSLSWGLSWSL